MYKWAHSLYNEWKGGWMNTSQVYCVVENCLFVIYGGNCGHGQYLVEVGATY